MQLRYQILSLIRNYLNKAEYKEILHNIQEMKKY